MLLITKMTDVDIVEVVAIPTTELKCQFMNTIGMKCPNNALKDRKFCSEHQCQYVEYGERCY